MEAQPKTFSLLFLAMGRVPSLSSRTMPSSAMFSHSWVADATFSSLTLPPPVARVTMEYMGPVRIRFTVMASASTMPKPACQRIRYFLDLLCLRQAIMTAISRTATTPKPINCDLIELRTLMTSSILMDNIVFSSLFCRIGQRQGTPLPAWLYHTRNCRRIFSLFTICRFGFIICKSYN